MAEFDDPTALVTATQRAYQAGYRQMDAYTPFPVEGLADALGFRRTRVPLIVLMGGLVGCVGGYFLQYYIAAIYWPLNVGGRPLVAGGRNANRDYKRTTASTLPERRVWLEIVTVYGRPQTHRHFVSGFDHAFLFSWWFVRGADSI